MEHKLDSVVSSGDLRTFTRWSARCVCGFATQGLFYDWISASSIIDLHVLQANGGSMCAVTDCEHITVPPHTVCDWHTYLLAGTVTLSALPDPELTRS